MIDDLVNWEPGILWAAVTCSAAGIFTLVGAMRGSINHRTARLMLAVSVIAIAATYWAEFAHWEGWQGYSIPDMRRGMGWVLWPALWWTAWSGMTYARKVNAAEQELRDAIRDDSEGRGEL